jgi:uncharacterized protein
MRRSTLRYCALRGLRNHREGNMKIRWLMVGFVASLVSVLHAPTVLAGNDPEREAALVNAAARGDVPKMQALIKADVPVEARLSKTQWTPLMAASMTGGVAAVKFLLGSGADVNATTPEGTTPLIIATLAGDREVAKILLAHKADVNHREKKAGGTALHFAISEGHVFLMGDLLKAGADPNAKTDKGLTPLVMALHKQDSQMVMWLLNHKADPNLESSEGTPLVVATRLNDRANASVLRSKGAKR